MTLRTRRSRSSWSRATRRGRTAGARCASRCSAAADVSVIPEGSAICYWEDAAFGDDAAPDGYRGQFLGWATRDATLFKLYRSRYALDVAGAAGWLDRLGGFAQTLIDPGKTPTQWHEMQHLTLDRAAHYALRSYTNILTLVNFYTAGVSDVAQTIDLSKRSVWGQIGELVRGYYGVAGCDTLGGIWLRRHYSYLDASEQAAIHAGDHAEQRRLDGRERLDVAAGEKARRSGWSRRTGRASTGR